MVILWSPLFESRGKVCPEPKALPWFSWSKHCFLSKKLLTVPSTSPLNMKPRHGVTPCWTCLPTHSYFPMTLILPLFLLFSDKELKELAKSLSAWSMWVDVGPSSSSMARTMSVVRSCMAFILMTTGAQSGPGMPVRHQSSALIVCQRLASLLPALFRFFIRRRFWPQHQPSKSWVRDELLLCLII